MKKSGPIGIYETFVTGKQKSDSCINFVLSAYHGEELYKADPYANEAELSPGTASRITDIGL